MIGLQSNDLCKLLIGPIELNVVDGVDATLNVGVNGRILDPLAFGGRRRKQNAEEHEPPR